MASFNYDGNNNIVQTLSSTTTVGAIAPLTNAAVQPAVDSQGAPNTLNVKTGAITTAAFQVNNTNGSGQIISVVSNPS